VAPVWEVSRPKFCTVYVYFVQASRPHNCSIRFVMYWVYSHSFQSILNTFLICIEPEVLTAVVMKSSVFWDITPCSPLSVNRRWLLSASRCFIAWLIRRPWRWRQHVPSKRWLTFNGLHGVISQMIELFLLSLLPLFLKDESRLMRSPFCLWIPFY
jgi:hypothetical protein